MGICVLLMSPTIFVYKIAFLFIVSNMMLFAAKDLHVYPTFYHNKEYALGLLSF